MLTSLSGGKFTALGFRSGQVECSLEVCAKICANLKSCALACGQLSLAWHIKAREKREMWAAEPLICWR